MRNVDNGSQGVDLPVTRGHRWAGGRRSSGRQPNHL